jgi:hypothetical protein
MVSGLNIDEIADEVMAQWIGLDVNELGSLLNDKVRVIFDRLKATRGMTEEQAELITVAISTSLLARIDLCKTYPKPGHA